jgi:hypothetical protein
MAANRSEFGRRSGDAIPAAGTGATDHDQVTDGGWAVLREMLAPASTAFGQRFGSQAVRLLLALHADIPLDGSGSGFLGLLLIMLGQNVGFPVPEGGAGKLAEAMRDRFLRYGGEVVCNAEVTKITVEHGRAIGVQVHDQFVRARRAVLADVAAEHLYGRLVTFDELRCHRRYGPGWPVFAGTLGPSRSTMRSGVQCRGARRRRTPPEPFMSATPVKCWSSARPADHPRRRLGESKQLTLLALEAGRCRASIGNEPGTSSPWVTTSGPPTAGHESTCSQTSSESRPRHTWRGLATNAVTLFCRYRADK